MGLNLRLLDHKCRVIHAELSQFFARRTLYEQHVLNAYFFQIDTITASRKFMCSNYFQLLTNI